MGRDMQQHLQLRASSPRESPLRACSASSTRPSPLRTRAGSSTRSSPLRARSASSTRSRSSSFSRSSRAILSSWSLMMAGMSPSSVDRAFCLGASFIFAQAEAKRRASTDSSRFNFSLCSASRMCSTLLPPSEDCSSRVSFDSRKGMCDGRFALANASTTFLRQSSERLIMMPSLARCEPTALPVLTIPSEPARSRRLSRAWVRPRPTTIQSRSTMSSACERLEVAFMLVDSVARAAEPLR
mmetsp:Transcript_1741/g.4372  ORF Transcript_1741/g.4372 Transcript_1741/m.4372 type:complete len:241 (+) Transcript_1741:175-897(+)